ASGSSGAAMMKPPRALSHRAGGANAMPQDRHFATVSKARIDAIERVDVPSALGCFSYRAIQYVREPNPPVSARLLLAYRSILLGEIQGTLPSAGVMICGPKLEPRQVKLDALEGKVRELLKELGAQLEGTKEAPLALNSHCAICEFRSGCWEEALKID